MLKRSKWLLSSTLGRLDRTGMFGMAKEEQDYFDVSFLVVNGFYRCTKRLQALIASIQTTFISNGDYKSCFYSQEKENDDTKGLFFRLHFLCGIYHHLYFS